MLFLLIFLVGRGVAAADTVEEQDLCPGWRVRGFEIPSFTDTERRLICGDPQSQAWKRVPKHQAKYFASNFLQDRGFFNPEFIVENGMNIIVLPRRTRVSRVVTVGAPENFPIHRKRNVHGEVLTPALLNSVEKWVTQRLHALGYPCPRVISEADPDTGVVVVNVKPGSQQNLVEVIPDHIGGVVDGAMRRRDAFQLGKLYNGDLLTISSNRILRMNFADSAYFAVECGPKGAVAREELVVGPPRVLSFAAGVSTEGLIQGRLSWRNTRLGRLASVFDFTALANSNEQRLVGTFDWYYLPYVSRRSLRPTLEFSHQNETYFETLSGRTQLALSTTYDNQKIGLSALVGPALEFVRTIRGASEQGNSHYLFLEGTLSGTNHEYEYFQTSPRSGYTWRASMGLSDRDLLSSISIQRIGLQGEALWNYRKYDPPLWVLGFRWALYTSLTGERPGEGSPIPPNFLYFLGGSRDLRGFGRNALPTSGIGALTSVYGGLEWRWAGDFPFGMEPFVFEDVGALGENPASLDAPVYYSPGVGLRWSTPVGVFRTTFAHGFPSGSFEFYFSFGEEF